PVSDGRSEPKNPKKRPQPATGGTSRRDPKAGRGGSAERPPEGARGRRAPDEARRGGSGGGRGAGDARGERERPRGPQERPTGGARRAEEAEPGFGPFKREGRPARAGGGRKGADAEARTVRSA